MRNGYKTRFKADRDRPTGAPRALRFPAEIDEVLEEVGDWKGFITEAVQEKISSRLIEHREEGDPVVALEMYNRLRVLLPRVVKQLPEQGCLVFKANGVQLKMVLSDRPWSVVQGSSEFKLQLLNDDWLIEGGGAMVWSELEKAQEFCDNMMHVWEQVMLSFEFADRLE